MKGWNKIEELKNKFLKSYIKWIKDRYPSSTESVLELIAKSYIDYYEYIGNIDNLETLEKEIKIAKEKTDWTFSTREEVLLNIMLSGEYGSEDHNFVDKSLIMLNAHRLNKRSLGFKNFTFQRKLDSKGLLPYNRDIENYLYKLNSGNLLDLEFNSAPKAKIREEGITILKQKRITYYIKKREYKDIIIPQFKFEEYCEKSLIEREYHLERYLL